MFRCHLVILANTYRCSIVNAFLWPWGVCFVYTMKGKHYMGHALNSLVLHSKLPCVPVSQNSMQTVELESTRWSESVCLFKINTADSAQPRMNTLT